MAGLATSAAGGSLKIQIGIGEPSGYSLAYLQLRDPAFLEQNGGYLNEARMAAQTTSMSLSAKETMADICLRGNRASEVMVGRNQEFGSPSA